jgi:hypothetical protein
MQTLIMIGSGFGLLAVMVMGAYFCHISGPGHMAETARLFIPVWFVVAAINMGIGVVSGGAPVLVEALGLIVIFALPALPAWWLARRLEGM